MELSHQHRPSLLRCLWLGLLLPALTPLAAAEVVDRVAATVDEEVITLTDLNWFIRFRRFSPPEDPAGREAFYREVLDQLINQAVVFRESAKTPFVQVTQEELNRFVTQYAGRFDGERGLENEMASLGLTRSLLRDMLRRQLAVNKFVELRFEPFVIVLPDEIEDYYRGTYSADLQALGQDPPALELVEETIRQILSVQKTTEQLESWLQNTRQRFQIRVLLFRDPPTKPNLPEGLGDRIEWLENPFSKNSSSNR